MSFVVLVGLVVALAVVIAARRNRRPRVTHIDRTIERKDGDDA